MAGLFHAIEVELYQIAENIAFAWGARRIRRDAAARHARQREVDAGWAPPQPPPDSPYVHPHSWFCGACDRANIIFVDKYAAGLDSEADKTRLSCHACGSTFRQDERRPYADPDADVLAFWARDPEAYLIPQDEDLILAGVPLVTLLTFADGPEALSERGRALVEAILVKVRDGELTEGEAPVARDWLRRNRARWDRAGIWEYLRCDVDAALQAAERIDAAGGQVN